MACVKLATWPAVGLNIYLYNDTSPEFTVKLNLLREGIINDPITDKKLISKIKERGRFTIMSSVYNGSINGNDAIITNSETGQQEKGVITNDNRYKLWRYYSEKSGSDYGIYEDCPATLARQPPSGSSAYPTSGSTHPPPVGTYPTYGPTGPPTGLSFAFPQKYRVHPYTPPVQGSTPQYIGITGNPVIDAYVAGSAIRAVAPAAQVVGSAAAQVVGSVGQEIGSGVADCVGGVGAGCVDISVGCAGCGDGLGGCDGLCLGGKRNKTRKSKKTRRRNKKSRKMRRKA